MDEWKKRAKDSNPLETVKKIEGIFSKNNFDYEYEQHDSDITGIFSSALILKYKDLVIRSNGKGSNSELTKASAFAEMMERLENIMFYPLPYVRNKQYIQNLLNNNPYPKTTFENEMAKKSLLYKYVNVVAKESDLYQLSPDKVIEATGLRFKEIFFDHLNNQMPLDVFYNYATKKDEMLPWEILKWFFTSNGMAAGNTLEEAIVQGLCEIFERYSQGKMFAKEVVFPEIPREVAFESDYIKTIVTEIESKGYRVYMKDASLGKNFPVVASFIVNPKNGKVAYRFGSHPSMEIALERSFTETFQGAKVLDKIGLNDIVFNRADDWRSNADFNAMKTGLSSIQFSYLIDKPTYEFKRWNENKALNNKEMAKYMLDLIVKEGYTPYISDNSFLGFPAVCIIVPFFSEAKQLTSNIIYDIRERLNLAKDFRSLDKIDDKEAKRIREYSICFRKSVLDSFFDKLLYFTSEDPTGVKDFVAYLCTLLSIYIEDYENAYLYTEACIRTDANDLYLKALLKYFEGRKEKYDYDYVIDSLSLVYDNRIVERVVNVVSEPKKVLTKIFMKCDDDCQNCTHHKCNNGTLHELYSNLQKAKYNYHIGTKDIGNLFN